MEENTIKNMYSDKKINTQTILQSYSYISGYLMALKNNTLITQKRYNNLYNLNEQYFINSMELSKKKRGKIIVSRYTLRNIKITKEMKNKVMSGCQLSVSDKFPREGIYNIDYGFDCECGWFIQFDSVDSVAKKETEKILGIEITIDIDGKFEGLNNYSLAYILQILPDVPKNHIDCIELNLPIEE